MVMASDGRRDTEAGRRIYNSGCRGIVLAV